MGQKRVKRQIQKKIEPKSVWLRRQQINEKITNYSFRDNKIDGFHYRKPSDLCLR